MGPSFERDVRIGCAARIVVSLNGEAYITREFDDTLHCRCLVDIETGSARGVAGDFLTQVEPTRAEPGCLSYELHVDETDGCVFMFYENWRSRADLDAHMTMPHLKPLQSRLDDLLARPPDIRFYEILTASARA